MTFVAVCATLMNLTALQATCGSPTRRLASHPSIFQSPKGIQRGSPFTRAWVWVVAVCITSRVWRCAVKVNGRSSAIWFSRPKHLGTKSLRIASRFFKEAPSAAFRAGGGGLPWRSLSRECALAPWLHTGVATYLSLLTSFKLPNKTLKFKKTRSPFVRRNIKR